MSETKPLILTFTDEQGVELLDAAKFYLAHLNSELEQEKAKRRHPRLIWMWEQSIAACEGAIKVLETAE